jgi:hypothetical protein
VLGENVQEKNKQNQIAYDGGIDSAPSSSVGLAIFMRLLGGGWFD